MLIFICRLVFWRRTKLKIIAIKTVCKWYFSSCILVHEHSSRNNFKVWGFSFDYQSVDPSPGWKQTDTMGKKKVASTWCKSAHQQIYAEVFHTCLWTTMVYIWNVVFCVHMCQYGQSPFLLMAFVTRGAHMVFSRCLPTCSYGRWSAGGQNSIKYL